MGYFKIECGIYKITNIINKKTYIGSSISVNERILSHKNSLTKNTHYNKYLQRAWNKYGEDSFVFEVIESVDKDKLIEREQFYVNEYKSADSSHGYNLNEVVNSPLGRKLDLDSRRNVSIAHGGTEFYVFKRVTKEFVGAWINQCECADYLKISSKWVNQCLNKRAKSAKGFIFLYENNIENIDFNYYNNIQHANTKPFKVYNVKDNEYLGTWEKQSDCALDLNIPRWAITRCLNNKASKYKTYVFRCMMIDT